MNARRERLRAPLTMPWALVVAAASSAVLTLAFAPVGWWPLAFVGVAGELWALRGRGAWAAALIGLVSGAVFWCIHIFWITVYLGPVPLIALALFMSLWRAAGGVLIAAAWSWGMRHLAGLWSVALLPLLLAGLYTARELVSARVPWDGFAWGRIAYSQTDSPFGDAVSWVGVSGLTFLIAAVSALVLMLCLRKRGLGRRRMVVAAAAIVAFAAIGPAAAPATGVMRVGAVQGASEAGLLAAYVPGQTLQQHFDAASELEGDFDLLVWPENAAEFFANDNPVTMAKLGSFAASHDAPLIVGTTTREGDDTYNSLMLLGNDGELEALYHKRHPVPFAEYLPSRAFFEPILSALGFLEYIPRDYSIDPSTPNAFDLGTHTAGVAICFDIIDDALIREMVLDHGAEIIIAPTNNADFGEGSAENVQQLQIAQMRAIEAGRSLVNISTVGTSAMVLPDGSMLEQLPQYRPGVMQAELPTSSTITPAIRFGGTIDILILLLPLVALAWLAVQERLSRRTRG